MDTQTLTIIATIIGTPVVGRLVDAWLNTRKLSHDESAHRLDQLEADVTSERRKNEEISGKLFDLAVKHEGLLVRFELLQRELSLCKEQEHGSAVAVSN